MSERRFIEALNDSINRLAAKQTVEDCLCAYPDAVDELGPLLVLAHIPHHPPSK
jgi:hypothetical protein